MDYETGKQFEYIQAKLDMILEKLYPEEAKKRKELEEKEASMKGSK